MQELLSILKVQADNLNLSCNVNTTVCMIFNPLRRDRCIAANFSCFKIGSSSLNFVPKFKFKYLGHLITNDPLFSMHSANDQSEDADIQREIHNMSVRSNVLLRRFYKRSAGYLRPLWLRHCSPSSDYSH